MESSFISSKEHLVELAKGFNLLSNVFMSVALKDIPACQHVIRIITGIPELVVKEVRSQYRISKVTSHDAILDILAEDVLSARVHFLKCEEGGFQEVCEVSEKIYQEGLEEGRAEGEMRKARESALNMKKEGLSESMIARILNIGPELVQQWLAEVSVQIERNIPKINQ